MNARSLKAARQEFERLTSDAKRDAAFAEQKLSYTNIKLEELLLAAKWSRQELDSLTREIEDRNLALERAGLELAELRRSKGALQELVAELQNNLRLSGHDGIDEEEGLPDEAGALGDLEAQAKEETEKALKKAERRKAREAAVAERLRAEDEAAEELRLRTRELDVNMTDTDFALLLDAGQAPDKELLQGEKALAVRADNNR